MATSQVFEDGTLKFETYADLVEAYIKRSREIADMNLGANDFEFRMVRLKVVFKEYAKGIEKLI